MSRNSNEQLVGRTIAGKFIVESLIGSGAMGAVFRARQVALEKTVAIKVLHGEHADDPSFAARFHREAKAASRLNHPNSMQVIDFGAEPDGLLYIAMEYLDGRSLHRVLHEESPLAPARIADILMQTLAALAVAHDMGVVHRDLKPENIVVLRSTDDDGRPRDLVKVCDFGIAKITDARAYRAGERVSNAPVTTAGGLVGTPEYMSPEQCRGDKLDARSDLYSLGVVLYEMLSGRPPFHAESALGVVFKHITEVAPRPSEIATGVDPRLEVICERALRKDPGERYQTAREMRLELRAVVDGRAMLGSVPDLESAPLRAAPSATGYAETQAMSAPASPVAASELVAQAEPPPKPTLVGTSSPAPVSGGRPQRNRLVLTAVLACLGGLAATAVVMVEVRGRSKASLAAMTNRPADAPIVGAPTAMPLLPATAESLSELEHTETISRSPGLSHSAAHQVHAAGGNASSSNATPGIRSGIAALATPANVANGQNAATPASSAAALAPGLSPAAPSVAMVAPVPPPPAAPPVLPPPPQPAAPDPSFDPSTGYVEVGLINAQGVRESAVRGALHGVPLSPCYRAALVAHAARATGVATLNLSIDDSGATRSAIVVGADFLPGLARCLQGAASGIGVPKSKVDPGGGTVEVTLALKVR